MIRAVFFDMTDTLVHLSPTQEELLVLGAQELGVTLTLDDARLGFARGAEFWIQETAQLPMEARSPDQRVALYREYDQRVFRAAGVTVSQEIAYQIFRRLLQSGRESRWVLFEDALPTLTALRARGLTLGLISNASAALVEICQELGLAPLLDFFLSSEEVGMDKPHPAIFQAALRSARVGPKEVLHVGDQYYLDVVGAQGVGITPLLVDRYDLSPQFTDCVRIRSLAQVLEHVP